MIQMKGLFSFPELFYLYVCKQWQNTVLHASCELIAWVFEIIGTNTFMPLNVHTCSLL